MKLDLTYPEISLLRKLVTDHRYAEFLALIKGSKKAKTMSIDELSEAQRQFNAERNPHCEMGLYGSILDKFEEVEDKIRESIHA